LNVWWQDGHRATSSALVGLASSVVLQWGQWNVRVGVTVGVMGGLLL
jgi:hypothetical protein